MSWHDRYVRLRKQLDMEQPPPRSDEDLVPFKVPAYLKEVKPSQYTPDTVSLGLNTRLEPGIERYKVDSERSFLNWKTSETANRVTIDRDGQYNGGDSGTPSSSHSGAMAVLYTWDEFVADLDLDEDVQTATKLYEIHDGPVQPNILKNFLAIDALFLVMFLRYSVHKSSSIGPREFPGFENVYKELDKHKLYRHLAEARSGIWRDVFLLENQISLHILTKVWMSMPDMESRVRTKDDAMKLFNKLLREVVKDRYLELFETASDSEATVVSNSLAEKNFLDCAHLLDCLHYVVCYSPPGDHEPVRFADEKAFAPANTIPSATQLRKVGIRLKPDGCNFIHQINFANSRWRTSVLHLPRLCISDRTESVLRNLAVFEMVSCYQSSQPQVGPRLSTITSYIILIDKLIDSEADVRLMKKDGVLISCLGSNGEMCEMWTALGTRFSLYQHSLWVEMLEKLMTRYKNRRYQYMAEFKHRYFARPWIVVSWFGVFILLFLTALQTVYTMLSYYKSL